MASKKTVKPSDPDLSTAKAITSDDVVTIDRRSGDRRAGDTEAFDVGVMNNPRRKQNRRRHIDPTTCERDYNDAEVEFMKAMDDYKRDSGRMFPTCSEVLEVVRSLGYIQLTDDQFDQLGLDVNDTGASCDSSIDETELEEELV